MKQSDPPDVEPTWEDLLDLVPPDGRWYEVRSTYKTVRSAHTVASDLRKGRRPIPPGLWEFRGGANSSGQFAVWARRTKP